jgi:hypothetical protein
MMEVMTAGFNGSTKVTLVGVVESVEDGKAVLTNVVGFDYLGLPMQRHARVVVDADRLGTGDPVALQDWTEVQDTAARAAERELAEMTKAAESLRELADAGQAAVEATVAKEEVVEMR